jgi:hypothetical protein
MMRKFFAALLLLPALACAQILGGTTPSTGFGANPGISGQTTQPSFAAALTTTIVPGIALGSSTATFTRATTATVTDQDGAVRTVLSGESRFQGARRIRNLLTATEAMTGGGWASTAGGTGSAATATGGFTAPDGTATAFRIQANRNAGNGAGDFSAWQQGATNNVGQVWIKSNTGLNQDVLTSFTGAGTRVTATPTWQLLTWTNSGPAVQFCIGTLGTVSTTNSVDVLVWHPQAELTTGQADPGPGEYVSVGVLASPFQGANVDGVQYFSTRNTYVVQQNLSLRSQQFTAAAWSPANVTVVEDVTTAPDGTLTADSLTSTLTNASRNSTSATVTVGQIYTASGYCKSTSNVMCFVSIDNGGGLVTAYVKGTLTGSGATSTGGAGTVLASSITPVGSSWYRLSLTFVANASSTRFSMGVWNPASADASGYPGAVLGDQVFAWGSQLNPGSFASTYVPTTTVAINNGIVETGLAPQIPSTTLVGYLAEGARTNSLRNSQMTGAVVGTPGTAPTNWVLSAVAGQAFNVAGTGFDRGQPYVDIRLSGNGAGASFINLEGGTQVAAVSGQIWDATSYIAIVGGTQANVTVLNLTVQENNAGGTGLVSSAVSFAAAAATTTRFEIPRTLNQATTAFVQPYLRIDTVAGAVDITVRIMGPQLEQAAFSSSYIPTTTVAVTRNLDTLTYPTAGNVLGTAGSAYAEFTLPIASTVTNQYVLDLNSGGNSPPMYYSIGGTLGIFDGTTQSLTPAFAASSVPQKIGSNWGGATMNTFAKGVAGTPAAFDGNMGAGANMVVGNGNVLVTVAYGNVRNLLLWTTKLTDAQMQGQTGP